MAKAPNGFVRLRRCLDGKIAGDFYVRPSALIAVFQGTAGNGSGVLLNADSGKAFVLDGFLESPATVARRVAAAEGGENAK